MGRGRAPCCVKVGLNKGSWTPEEDARLVAYIKKHGHENWRALPKQAGLLRCGKSCRLRWINYLRPDIKRGNFTFDEEETIIKLHGAIGNKWSKIASYLPGRTDNEIKNVWNTHLKKRVEPKEKKTSLPSSPSSSASISYSEQCEGDNKNEPVPNEKIELVIEPQKSETSNTGSWAANPELSNGSPSSSLSDSFATSSNNEMDLFEEMLNIQVESELDENFLELFSSEAGSFEDEGTHWNLQGESNEGPMESKGWLEDLEKELELEGASEVDPQWSEMEGDPVSNYFQTSRPTSPSPLDLLHVDPFRNNVMMGRRWTYS